MPRWSSMRSIDGRSLDLDDVVAVARQREPVRLAPAAAKRVDASRRALEKVVAKGSLAYGIKTGFGELANVAISDADVRALQLNLLRSHAIGLGPPLRRDEVRAALLLRANTLAMGYSGVRPILVTRRLDVLRGPPGFSEAVRRSPRRAEAATRGAGGRGEPATPPARERDHSLPQRSAQGAGPIHAAVHSTGVGGRPCDARERGGLPADRDERRDGQPADLPGGDERQRRELPRAGARDGPRPRRPRHGRPRGFLGTPDCPPRRHATQPASALPDREERPEFRHDDRAIPRPRLRERQQSPRPSGVGRLHPAIAESEGLLSH